MGGQRIEKARRRYPLEKVMTKDDIHALAAYFALHHASLAIKDGRAAGPRNIERIVMATFGLCTKNGPFRLTRRGRRAVKLAQSD